MGQITIAAVATYGTTTLSTSIIYEAESVQQGALTATTTYAQITETLSVGSGTPQVVAVYNAGSVDVSVRLLYSATKYYFLNVPPTCTVMVPTSIIDGLDLVDWQALSVRCVTGTCPIEYVVIR